MKNFFKPLTRRDAIIASVIIGGVIISLIISIVKDLMSGLVFDDIRSSFLMLFFFALIEYGMITILKAKNAEKENDNDDKTGGDDSGAE